MGRIFHATRMVSRRANTPNTRTETTRIPLRMTDDLLVTRLTITAKTTTAAESPHFRRRTNGLGSPTPLAIPGCHGAHEDTEPDYGGGTTCPLPDTAVPRLHAKPDLSTASRTGGTKNLTESERSTCERFHRWSATWDERDDRISGRLTTNRTTTEFLPSNGKPHRIARRHREQYEGPPPETGGNT